MCLCAALGFFDGDSITDLVTLFNLFIYVPQNLNWAFQILYLGLESCRQEGLVLKFCK